MRKSIIILVIFISCFVLTACGSREETLDCTLEQENKVMQYKATLKGNEVLNFTYLEKLTLANDNLAQQTYTQLKQTLSIFSAYEGITVENTIDGNVINSSMTVDFEKLTKEGKENLSFDFETATDLKNLVEDNGYTCN